MLSLVIKDCSYSFGRLFRSTIAATWPIDAIWIQARDFSSFPWPCACAQVSRRGAQASAQARQRDRASAGRGIWQLAFLQKEEAAAAGGSGSSSSRKATAKGEIDGGTGLWVTGVGGRSVTANHTRFRDGIKELHVTFAVVAVQLPTATTSGRTWMTTLFIFLAACLWLGCISDAGAMLASISDNEAQRIQWQTPSRGRTWEE